MTIQTGNLPTTALEAARMVAAATFGPLTAEDRAAYADAPADAEIAAFDAGEDGAIWMTILASSDRIEFYRVDPDGDLTDAAFDFHG